MANAPQASLSLPAAKSRRQTWRRRLLIAAVALVLAVAAGTSGLAFFVGWSLTHPARKAIAETPDRYGLAYTDVTFPSRGGAVTLKGWFLPARGDKKGMTLVFAHGYRGNRTQPDVPALAVAQALAGKGYDLLLFDFRSNGESEGSFTSVGQYETDDLLGAIDWVRRTGAPGQPVGVIGFSMGASTALMAAAAEPDVAGVVADSPFSNLKRYLEANLSIWSNLPHFPFTPLILAIMPPVLGVDPAAVDPLSAVDRIYPRPILFIHNEADGTIPYTESEMMWQRHPDRFQFWKPAEGGHVGTYKTYPEEYISRVEAFFDAAIAG
jgi:uncharacterized protein